MIITNKGDLILLVINNKIVEVTFSHWEKPHNNGEYFFDIKGNRYSIKQCA